MIDLVLVNPNGRVPTLFAAVEPPLWLGLIASYHLGQGNSVAIVDAEAEGLTIAETVQRVKALSPRETIIVVMGNNPSVSSTPKMPVAQELLKELPARLVGLHPNALNCPGTIRHPFEGFPSVPWQLLPLEKYRAHNWHCLGNLDQRGNYASLYTSLNCPYSCSYCNIHALYGDRQVRLRPLGDIKAELLQLSSLGIRNIKLWDELFTLDETRVIEICDFLSQWGFKFNIWAYARVDSVSEKMLAKMKQAGVNWLAYGFESAQEGKSKNARRAVDMTRAAGISIIANFMFGLPGETQDSMKASLEMAVRENFEYVNFTVALPYPGSPWYDSLKVKPTDWASFSQFSPNICAVPAVVEFRDRAFQTYFGRPEYLSMIREKFGAKAEAHIKEMLKWKPRS